MLNSKLSRGLLLASVLPLLAACGSDGVSGTGGGGGAPGTLTTPQLGVTGSGGVTEGLGVAALTDPILGTEGLLGGGSSGELGGVIPMDQLAPISSQLSPVVDQISGAIPLDMVTGQIPGLGVNGKDGLLVDLTGQDPLTGIVGTNGVVGGLLAGGNGGALGDIVPAGTIPSLPGGSGDPTALLGDLTAGTPLAALSGALPTGGDPTAKVQDALGLLSTLGTAVGGSNPTDLLGTVTSLVPVGK